MFLVYKNIFFFEKGYSFIEVDEEYIYGMLL